VWRTTAPVEAFTSTTRSAASLVKVNSAPPGSVRRSRLPRSSHAWTVSAPLRSVTAIGLPQSSYWIDMRRSSPSMIATILPTASWT
jgi:hypothetical protein